jgi:hypothetical protein
MPRYKKKSHLQYEKRDTQRTIRDTPNKRLKRICSTTTPKKSVKRKRATVLTPLASAKRRLQLLFSPQEDNNLSYFETVNYKSPISSTKQVVYTAYKLDTLPSSILSPCKLEIQTASAKRSETKTKKEIKISTYRNTE